MNSLTIGLFFSPWDPHLESPAAVQSRNPLTMYRRAVWFKANPRDEKYMRDLFTEYFREGVFINIDRDPFWHDNLREADMVVLLYPDAIGQGFYRLETKVQRRKKTCAAIRALNGRRREFLLNRATLYSLRVRRIMERWMLGEVVALILFVFITPVLLVIDLLRGRL
jgi:hypothetical protein